MAGNSTILNLNPTHYRVDEDSMTNLGTAGGSWNGTSVWGDWVSTGYGSLPRNLTLFVKWSTTHSSYVEPAALSSTLSSSLSVRLFGAYPNSADGTTGQDCYVNVMGKGVRYAGSVALNDGSYHTLAVVINGTSARCFFDGEHVGTITGLSGSYSANTLVEGPGAQNVDVKDTALFPIALTDQNIADMHAAVMQTDFPVDVTATPATASGLMTDAAFDNASHVSVSAPAATASAITNDAVVSATRDPNIKRVLSPGSSGTYTPTQQNLKMGYYTGWNVSFSFSLFAPGDEAKPHPDDTFESMVLNLAVVSVETPPMGGYFNVQYDSASAGRVSTRVDIVDGKWLYRIPLHTDITGEISIDHRYVTGRVSVDNPINDLGTQSYFDVEVNSISRTIVAADPMTATALMANADGSVLNSVSIGAVTATASAEMPGGYRPDAQFAVAVMDVSANMGWGYFRSDRRVYVGAAEAGGFMYESTDHRVEKEMTISVSNPARGRAGSLEPAAVNDKEIDINLGDPYWNRVARKSTEGPLPPSANLWFRLNQREGNFAQHLSSAGVFVTNPPSGYTNGYNIEGDFEWGAAGPNGKRGLIARNAVFGRSTTGTYDQNTPGHRSVEYTVRVEPGHTGRMEIARGRERHFSGLAGSPDRTFYTGIHDGKVYFGGHSIKRIDDGEWHHVVVTTTQDGSRIYFEIYIDGELDRTLTSVDNIGGIQGFVQQAAPVRFLGGDTDYPFQGEILDIVTRAAPVLSHEVKELYLDMFGFKAARAGAPMTASADSYQGHKVISSMKRMLLVSWMPVGSGEFQAQRIGSAAWNDKGFYERSITAAHGQLGPMLGYGWDEEMDLGRYLVTVVQPDKVGSYNTALKPEVLEQNRSWMFVDKVTGRQRMLDLVNDVDLDQFDVIAFQSYPNKQYEDQYERQMNEAFLESVRTALVRGKKMWITDPYLAADLGLISDVEEVPTLGAMYSDGRIRRAMGYDDARRDVRGYEVAPFIGLNGGKHPKPANGALPGLYAAIPDGSHNGIHDIWSGDVHHNNGYRVVNEIEGLTDIPSWELDEMFWRDRTNMLPQADDEYYHRGIRMENRTGIDYEWGPDDGSDNFPAKKESKGTGLKVGDEFYDYLNFDNAYHYFRRPSSPVAKYLRSGRVDSTWAVPPGHLKVGTPVTTFRRTLWNDYGDEIVNPYRDFIRNAVIRPGDRLPDGRKISGYAYMEFAEHPSFEGMAGVSWTKQLTGLPGEYRNEPLLAETEYSFDWDYVTTVRRSYTGGGSIPSTQIKFHYGPRSSNGVTQMASKGEKIEWLLPSAPTIAERYATISMPHQTWNSRGISWLTMVDVEGAEVALAHQGGSAQADAGMLSPMVDVEFDNEVSVEAAQASGRIVDPGETVIKSTNVLAYAATARGTMTGLQGGYKAEAATSFGYMPQNVRRPLDVEEVLFFTVSFTQETIYVRMEEN